MRQLILPSGNAMPVFGLGTWRMGEHSDRFKAETDVIRGALDLGITLIDTAEMYGEGGAEEVIGAAIHGRRDDLFLVSKFYPHNASRTGVIEACERSLQRMKCDYIDLYLLHWPGGIPLTQTFDALQALQESGKIRDYGVSNFDFRDLQAVPEVYQAGLGCNQVFYNLAHREPEWAVADWCRQHGTPLMAYSPLDQAGALLQSSILAGVAESHGASAAQIALAWLLHRPETAVIPKSVKLNRIEQNLAAADIVLTAGELQELDAAFPAPQAAVRLGMR